MQTDPADGPRRATARRNPPLTPRQRWTAVALAVACVLGAAAVTLLLGFVAEVRAADVVWSAVVYGGLLAAAAVVLYVDRAYALQCLRCGSRHDRGAERCPSCGYDVRTSPRYACDEGHGPYVEPGVCDCGRRLRLVAAPGGVHRQVIATVKLGAGILAFLVAVWAVLAVAG